MANRADLATRCKKTKLCKFFLANACQRGDRCTYAHSVKEIRALPNLQCTQFCPTALSGIVCSDADCKFAHRREDLKKFPGDNSHKAGVRNTPEAGASPEAANLQFVQASLAAMPAQQAWMPAPSLVSHAFTSGIQGATVWNQDLVALKQAQTAISQALVNLEERIRATSNRGSTESQASDAELYICGKASMCTSESLAPSDDDDDVTADSDSQMGGLKPCWQESEHAAGSFSRQASWDNVSESSEPDIAKTVVDVGIAFGRHISDFGPVFGRQTSYKHEVEREGLPAARRSNVRNNTYAACDSTGLCIKNTFYTIMDEEPNRSSFRRSSSVPARLASSSADMQAANVSCDDAAKAPQKASKRHLQAICIKPTAQQEQCPQALSPPPAEPSQPGPVLLGRMTTGPTRNAVQVRKECGSAVLNL